MKKIITLFTIIFYTSNLNASSLGSGEFKLTDQGVEWFIYYIKSPGGDKFPKGRGMKISFTIDGNNGWYSWCNGAASRCVPETFARLNSGCEKEYRQPCKGFAVWNKIKWVNGTNPGGKDASFNKSDSIDEIIDKLIKLGFYEE